jgi:hypothetical protein
MFTLPKLFLGALLSTSIAFQAHSVCPAQTSPQQATSAQSTDAEKQPDAAAKHTQARPNPDVDGLYHIGPGVTPPRLIHAVEPKVLKKLNYNDYSCLISLTVDVDGNPVDVHFVRTIPEVKDHVPSDIEMKLQDISVQTVQQYRFQPATYQGKPVPVRLNVEVHFQKNVYRN